MVYFSITIVQVPLQHVASQSIWKGHPQKVPINRKLSLLAKRKDTKTQTPGPQHSDTLHQSLPSQGFGIWSETASAMLPRVAQLSRTSLWMNRGICIPSEAVGLVLVAKAWCCLLRVACCAFAYQARTPVCLYSFTCYPMQEVQHEAMQGGKTEEASTWASKNPLFISPY